MTDTKPASMIAPGVNLMVNATSENLAAESKKEVARVNNSATATWIARLFSGIALVAGSSAFVMGFFFPLVVGNPYIWMALAAAAALGTLVAFAASWFIHSPTLELAETQA